MADAREYREVWNDEFFVIEHLLKRVKELENGIKDAIVKLEKVE